MLLVVEEWEKSLEDVERNTLEKQTMVHIKGKHSGYNIKQETTRKSGKCVRWEQDGKEGRTLEGRLSLFVLGLMY